MQNDLAFIKIGIDDTDSPEGMCTTYVMHKIIQSILKDGGELYGFPNLIRLNPSCPYKTRGNAALSATFRIKVGNEQKFFDVALDRVFELSQINHPKTNPALLMLSGNEVPLDIIEFSRNAVKRLLDIESAFMLIKKYNLKGMALNGPRGLIGAMAALGYDFPSGYTYEIIAYRNRDMWGKPRIIDKESVIKMDNLTKNCTFDNFDYDGEEIKIAPHTPCPVLVGIRSTDHQCLENALRLLKINEPVSEYRIFKTNQATDDHIIPVNNIQQIEPFTSITLEGMVNGLPITEKGGHTFIYIEKGGERLRLAAYEPTKQFRKIILSLRPGDRVRIYGTFKPKDGEPKTINLEKIQVLEIAQYGKFSNPICPKCGHRMKSEGKEKGYQCPKCRYRMTDLNKEFIVERRDISTGVFDVPSRARRHLSKPFSLEVRK
ncbi:MAG: TiaS agmantine-binding domain-containing protein [Nitrososphaeria archaeon]